jgi:hypothetical protein
MGALKILCIGVLIAGVPMGVGAQEEKKEKSNLEFGKIQELEIELTSVPDSVGSG